MKRDLYGPGVADVDFHAETLDSAPSRWYLAGFLVPRSAPEEQRLGDAEAEGDLDSGDDAGGAEEPANPDRASKRRSWRASSLGLSCLLSDEIAAIEATVTWGDYSVLEEATPETGAAENTTSQAPRYLWQRKHRSERVAIDISKAGRARYDVPASSGLVLEVLRRSAEVRTESGTERLASISVFLVNERKSIQDNRRADETFIFQAHLALGSKQGFRPRHSLHGLDSEDWDERVADLHFRDVAEYAVGHNTAGEWKIGPGGACTTVSSCCTPLAAVTRVVPNQSIADFELGMERLGALSDPDAAASALGNGRITLTPPARLH